MAISRVLRLLVQAIFLTYSCKEWTFASSTVVTRRLFRRRLVARGDRIGDIRTLAYTLSAIRGGHKWQQSMAKTSLDHYGNATDAELVSLYRAGHPQAFIELWERNEQFLRNLAWGRRRQQSDVEDLVADVRVKAFVRLQNDLDNPNAVRTWLATMLENLATDRDRQVRRRPKLESLGDTDCDYGPGPRPRRPPPKEAELHEDCIAIRHCLSELSAELRETIVLRFWEDKTFDEIAREQGVNVSSAHRRFGRAIEQLTVCLARRRGV